MQLHEHHYQIEMIWTGNTGSGTANYRSYTRNHELNSGTKPVILGSSDPTFRGDGTRWNPEELLVSALSSCHMLAYLHLCADAGIVVTTYSDSAQGTMIKGAFSNVTLRPIVTITSAEQVERARELHQQAHHDCFIANSVNFPVECEPNVQV